MLKPLVKSKKRLLIVFGVIFIGMVLICLRVGWVQIVKGDEYAKMAIQQQTKDTTIAAKRGTIYDRNGTELAISAPCYSVWARPEGSAEGETEAEKKESVDNVIRKLAEILKMDEDEIRDKFESGKSLVKLTKYQNKKTADKIRKAELPGVEIAEDVKRFYPLGAFCSHVLGSVTDDNNGLSGIEKYYNSYLKGTSGKWIKDTAADGKTIYYGDEEKYDAEDGVGLVLTIDEVVQHYVEKAVASSKKETNAKDVWCLVMDPKTGDILAMASANEFDPNNAKVPLSKKDAKKVEKMSSDEQSDYWNNKMWRNHLINDTYEPGSTFKLLTLGAALEENVCTLNSTYTCNGALNVDGTTIKCWSFDKPHGTQTVKEATGNSCNPVFMQLTLKLGRDRFLRYLESFGVMDTTGIDYPGESNSIFLSKDRITNVDLATMGFGQSLNVTPIQLATAVSCYGNEGKLMQPRLVKALADENGDITQEIEPTVVRQVVSKKTVNQVIDTMVNNVENLGAKNAKVEGYKIAGKTGTAQKTENGKISEDTYSSFIGIAPAEDPKFTILFVVDSPRGTQYGSEVAAPEAKKIMEKVLRYMNVEPSK